MVGELVSTSSVRVLAKAGDIVLCCWARHFTLAVLLSIQGGVEILLVASCCGIRDKLRPGWPLGSYADFTFCLYLTFST